MKIRFTETDGYNSRPPVEWEITPSRRGVMDQITAAAVVETLVNFSPRFSKEDLVLIPQAIATIGGCPRAFAQGMRDLNVDRGSAYDMTEFSELIDFIGRIQWPDKEINEADSKWLGTEIGSLLYRYNRDGISSGIIAVCESYL